MSDDNIIHFNPWRDFNDAAPLADPFAVEPDAGQIARFVDVVFGYSDGLIPVRGFVDKGQGKDGRPHNIWIDADATAPEKLGTFAGWAAREGAAVYVIPGTVAETGQARAADVLQMQSLVVDLDSGDIPAKLDHLVHHLGRPTLIVESGGRTPEGATKLHVWWKLTEPAEGADLARLCQLRGEIALKVGGDTHFRSAHQPIRVPGTVYHKGGLTRLVQIRETTEFEVDLAEMAERVADMPPMPGVGMATAEPREKPAIDDVLVTPVHEGGTDDWSRFEGASAAIGYFLRLTPLLPTATAGSLPKPAWLAEPETLWSPWKLEGDALAEGKKDALRLALDDQRQAGIDIVSDGEQTRQHFVTTFIEHLDGVDFQKRETVRIRDRYDASVPTVVGAVARRKPVFVEDARFLRQQTRKPIKWALPGPMTMIDTLYDAHYRSREKLAWEFAAILNQEAKELEAAGIDIIQFDEPAFNVFFDEVNDWGVAALERAAEGLTCQTAVHICYGYGIKANTDWKKTLGAEWRQYEKVFPKLRDSCIGMVSLECHNSHVPMDLIELIRGKKVMVGAIDVASERIETPEEVAATLRRALQFVDAENLCPCTNCGMAPLPRPIARAKLAALSAGAAIVRKELSA